MGENGILCSQFAMTIDLVAVMAVEIMMIEIVVINVVVVVSVMLFNNWDVLFGCIVKWLVYFNWGVVFDFNWNVMGNWDFDCG